MQLLIMLQRDVIIEKKGYIGRKNYFEIFSCFRCLELGHVQQGCTSTTDRFD